MANEYVELATLKAALGVDPDDVSRDVLLTMAISAASRGIDRMTGRRFWLDLQPVPRIYRPAANRTFADDIGEQLIVDDIGTLNGLVAEVGTGDSWTAVTNYETAPDNALVRGRPITGLVRRFGYWALGVNRVRVTARWGWPAVPDEVVQATQIQASRLYKRKDSPEGITGSAEWGAIRLSRVDPDVQALVADYILPGFA